LGIHVNGVYCDWGSLQGSWSSDVGSGEYCVMLLHYQDQSLVLVVWAETWQGWMNGVVPEWQLS
jgi:hypothetical protein